MGQIDFARARNSVRVWVVAGAGGCGCGFFSWATNVDGSRTEPGLAAAGLLRLRASPALCRTLTSEGGYQLRDPYQRVE